jgi:uncharacterized protein DUF1648
MERKLFQVAVGLPWLVLPLTAFNYWRAWDRLPLRIAVHFDANWQPNGWSSREGSRMLALGMTAFLLVVFTVAGYAARHTATSSVSQWALVAVFYVVLGLVYWVNTWIVERNLQPRSKPLAELMILRDRDASVGFPQGLKPAILANGSGAARSCALSNEPFTNGNDRRSIELHS